MAKRKGRPSLVSKMTEGAQKSVKRTYRRKRTTILGRRRYADDKVVKYDKPTFIRCYEGYDILENMLLVRPYIIQKHGLDNRILEILLYLAPKNLFDYGHYSAIPHKIKSIETAIEQGYFRIVSTGKCKKNNVYRLTPKARRIVYEFYRLLSGEQQFAEDDKNNPFLAFKKPDQFTVKRMALIKALNNTEPSEAKKSLYRKAE